MKEVIGKSKLSTALILMEPIAKEYNLRLNRTKEFKKVREIVENKYNIMKWSYGN
jgi:hypothetical protein